MVNYREIKADSLEKILEIDGTKRDLDERFNDIYEEAKKMCRVMFIAESPPKYSKSKNYFYYVGEDAKQIGLIGALLTPLEDNDLISKFEDCENDDNKYTRLCNFIHSGYWLTDLFYQPIKDVDEITKEKIIDYMDALEKEIKSLDPKKIVIMLPKSSFKKPVTQSLIKHINGLNINDTEIELKNKNSNYLDVELKILKMILSLNSKKSEIKSKVAPFPNQGLTKQWCKKGVCSFSDWVSNYKENGVKIKEWLEIDGE